MNAELERFESGWVGVKLSMRSDEVDKLIGQLTLLREGRLSHFHCVGNFESEVAGVGDIEFSLQGDLPNNMSLG